MKEIKRTYDDLVLQISDACEVIQEKNIKISELEEINYEMLKELVKIYTTIYNTQCEAYWMPIKTVIEKATGQTIEEVLKR